MHVIRNGNTIHGGDVEKLRLDSIKKMGRAVVTLFFTPEHKRLYRDLAKREVGVIVECNPSVEDIVHNIQHEVVPYVRDIGGKIGKNRMMEASGVLIQFSDHLRPLPDELCIDYTDATALFEAYAQSKEEIGRPLGFDEQLRVALDVNNGNLKSALWHLFAVSRFYARWLDSNLVKHVPDMPDEEKIRIMKEWQSMLLSCKNGTTDAYHDTAGDVYYAWTHAAAIYYLQALSDNRYAKMATPVFRKGTQIMQTCANNFSPRGVMSNHDIAAQYGNAIGDACANYV